MDEIELEAGVVEIKSSDLDWEMGDAVVDNLADLGCTSRVIADGFRAIPVMVDGGGGGGNKNWVAMVSESKLE